jgi:hypothetical protein
MNTIIKFSMISLMVLVPLKGFADLETYAVTIKDHTFSPVELTIPAKTKVKLVVNNEDPTPEEFESYDLNREETVAGNGTITVFIGPLRQGKYKFFGDFNQDKAQGVIIAQ